MIKEDKSGKSQWHILLLITKGLLQNIKIHTWLQS